jgi:alcohol dehydrogenase
VKAGSNFLNPLFPPRMPVSPFDYQPATRIISGTDSLEKVGALARDLGAHRVLLVTDRGIASAGHPSRAVASLEAAGIQVRVFEGVRENPTTADVDCCVEAARALDADFLVGLGGGSSMDTAKGANFLLTNGGRIHDYWGVGKATKPMLPLIAIPTTAGTGSECQSFALISDADTHQKMACGDPKAAARVAILDPLLTLSQPLRVTACTGVDALAHALETAVTKKRTVLSAMFSREAFRLCMQGLEQVLDQPEDLTARAAMQIGAAFAGTAIENSMLGAAHSAANPLTAHLGMVHGHAVGIMLPAVIRFNAADPRGRAMYMEHAAAAGIRSIEELVERVEEVLDAAGMRVERRKYTLEPSLVPVLAEEAARQWTATFNPRPVGPADFAAFYQEVFA